MTKKQIFTSLTVIGLVLVVVTMVYMTKAKPADQSTVWDNSPVVTLSALDVSFSYPSGESGLTLIEPPTAEQSFAAAFLLLRTPDYIAFQGTSTPVGTEAPPAISVFVYPESRAEDSDQLAPSLSRLDRLRAWAAANNSYTSFALAVTEVESVELDGLPALHYVADGLYQQDIYLASYRGNIYVFIGQYDDETDPIRTAFETLINSVVVE